jgi:hypothetical protein
MYLAKNANECSAEMQCKQNMHGCQSRVGQKQFTRKVIFIPHFIENANRNMLREFNHFISSSLYFPVEALLK